MPSQSNVGVGPKILSACLLSSARRCRSSSEKFIRQLSTGHNSSHLRAEAMLAHNRPVGCCALVSKHSTKSDHAILQPDDSISSLVNN